MEVVAKQKYAELTDSSLVDVGLFINFTEPWLCATPDAIVQKKDGSLVVLEVKCPSSCREKDIAVPYLKNEELVKTDKYYTQVQLQLFCCNLKSADFFVFSSKDYRLVRVERDEAFL